MSGEAIVKSIGNHDITLTIDGNRSPRPKDDGIEAAKVGINIPALCYDKELNCGGLPCVVEIEVASWLPVPQIVWEGWHTMSERGAGKKGSCVFC